MSEEKIISRGEAKFSSTSRTQGRSSKRSLLEHHESIFENFLLEFFEFCISSSLKKEI